MGVFTRRQIAVTPVRLHTDQSLDDLYERALASRYPQSREKASHGWGSSTDDDEVLGYPVAAGLEVGRPQLLDATDGLPARLRLRYYWDQVDSAALRSVGDSAPWQRWNVREAMDVVILDEPERDTLVALISSRDRRKVKGRPLKGLEQLLEVGEDGGGAGRHIEFEGLAEELPNDFFAWLLYRLNGDSEVGQDVRLEVIEELSSRDRNLRGARFTDRATLERIELAALITMGDHKFGPAKIGLAVDDLDAAFELQLELDGGFRVYRSSEYDSRRVPDDELGHALVEDLWSIVVPRLREAYYADDEWQATGRDELKDGAVTLIRSILPAP